MFSLIIILAAIVVLGVSGLPACLMSPRRAAGQFVTAALMLAGSAVGVCGVVMSFAASAAPSLDVAWFLPCGRFTVTLDTVSAIFLLPIFVVPAVGAVYGLGYWKQSEHVDNGRQLGVFYGLLAGSMALVAISRDGILFLMAWEIMALAAYFAATVEDDNPQVRRAGWVYLIATHVGTLCLFAMFALWRNATGSFGLVNGGPIPSNTAAAIFILALIGFGFKAGLMPLHVWLPGAHANAPSHVSAVMSGVMLKMGIYGIVRMTSLLGDMPLWWGGVMLAVGAVTGIAGIAFAVGQSDIKRALAYSSIENIGIIAIGLGLAMLGRTQHRYDWMVLGFCGATLHVWNHSLFKPLLFFSAGAIIHATGTRNIEMMGGLAKRLPRVMILFTIGAAAICALPPLNGFVSEWLMYVGLFRTLGLDAAAGCPVAAIAIVAVAMIGAIAVACFVKLLGAVFLGQPRSDYASHMHKPTAVMMWPMLLLAAACAFIGLFPSLVVQPLETAADAWSSCNGDGLSQKYVNLHWISRMGVCLVAVVIFAAVLLKFMLRHAKVSSAGTWDCGYARPISRMEYTGSSFGQSIVGLFAFILWPKTARNYVRGLFPRNASFKIAVPDAVLERLVMPVFRAGGKYLPALRILQQGKTHLYLLYIMIIVIVLFICGTIGV